MGNEEFAKIIEFSIYFGGFFVFIFALAVLVGRGLGAIFYFLFLDTPVGWVVTGLFIFVYYLLIPFFELLFNF